jgi:ribosomal protein S10
MTNSSSKSFLFYTSLVKKSLYNYKNYIALILKKFNIKFKIIFLPKKKKIHTLLKSPHITKKAKESFELTFFRFVVIIDFNNKLLQILRSNVPNTMHLKCVITS